MNQQPKVIAYYLPQYHEIPENNEWWGKGFTEWTNVKKARPFFKGQIQPRVPLNHNYYDLMDRSTVEWQTELANRYGLYGFCYFHYYFKNGRKILEKPAENLLKWKDINQRFCFFWANVEWKRTWSTVLGTHTTSWTAEDTVKTGSGVLLEQDYGDEAAWKAHFDYLLPFFKDERYIKIGGRPVFAIYYISYIPRAADMFKVWDELAKENGFPGLQLLAVNEDPKKIPYVNGILHYGGGQLRHSLSYQLWIKGHLGVNYLLRAAKINRRLHTVLDYEQYWKRLLRDKPYGTVQNYPGATVRYDETPRRGENSLCLSNATPELFEKYMAQQLKRGRDLFGTEYLFLDAWNEWGEGNYLEPDEETDYQYLEALRNAITGVDE